MTSDVLGKTVEGRYRVDRELWHGPHTRSLLVTDMRNGRPCVLRLVSPEKAPPAEVRRFEALAAILAKLDHPGLPHFVAAFSRGEGEERERVLVTSYHPGESLERLVAKSRLLTESQALALLRRIVQVLVYLHSFVPPLVHRTVKLSGVIVGPDARPCLTDLDFAVPEVAATVLEQAPPGPQDLALAAPEVFMGGAVPASDIYALGLVIVRAMSPEDPTALLREGAKPRLRDALGVSESFAAVLQRMLEPSLERRYPDARVLEADLARLAGARGVPGQQQPATSAAEESPARRPFRPVVLAGVLLTLLALGILALLMFRPRHQPSPETSLLVTPTPSEPAAVQTPAAEPAGAPAVDLAAPAAAPHAALPPESDAPVTAPAQIPPEPPAASTPVPETPQPVAEPAPAVDTAPATVSGRLLLDGKPFERAGAPAPTFWLRDNATKSVVKPQVDYAAGAFTIRGLLPGRYGMSVRIDLNPSNPGNFPGDVNGWIEFAVEAGRPVSLEIPLRRVIRLQQPVDNGAAIGGQDVPCGAGNVTPTKVVFAWEALDTGVIYETSVDRLVCGRGYASAGRVFRSSSAESWVKVDLEPSREGECYSFRLTARKAGGQVGILTTHGVTGFGWDFRFSVK